MDMSLKFADQKAKMHDIFSNKIWQLWMPLLTTLPLSQPASKKRELPLVCFRTTETHQANFHKLFSLIYTVLSLMDSLGLASEKIRCFLVSKNLQIFYQSSRWYTKLCCQTLAQNMCFLFSMISSYFPLTRETDMKEFLQNF